MLKVIMLVLCDTCTNVTLIPLKKKPRSKINPKKKKKKQDKKQRNKSRNSSIYSWQWARAHLLPLPKRQSQPHGWRTLTAVHVRRNRSADRRRSWWWTWPVESWSSRNPSRRKPCSSITPIATSATPSRCTSAHACHASPTRRSFSPAESTSSSLSRILISPCPSISSAISPLKPVPHSLTQKHTTPPQTEPPLRAVRAVPSPCKLVLLTVSHRLVCDSIDLLEWDLVKE